MNCRELKSVLPGLLLNPSGSNTDARAHLGSCSACREEFHSLEATFHLLDAWTAPEPSPYFDQKLAVRLREEQQREPEGWMERVRARLLFNTGRPFRPALAGALAAIILLVGGGTIANLHHGKPPISATVIELQNFDKNAQTIQNLEILDDADDAETAVPAS